MAVTDAHPPRPLEDLIRTSSAALGLAFASSRLTKNSRSCGGYLIMFLLPPALFDLNRKKKRVPGDFGWLTPKPVRRPHVATPTLKLVVKRLVVPHALADSAMRSRNDGQVRGFSMMLAGYGYGSGTPFSLAARIAQAEIGADGCSGLANAA